LAAALEGRVDADRADAANRVTLVEEVRAHDAAVLLCHKTEYLRFPDQALDDCAGIGRARKVERVAAALGDALEGLVADRRACLCVPRFGDADLDRHRQSVLFQTAHELLRLAPVARWHPQRDVAALETVELPVGRDGRLHPGLAQVLAPRAGGLEVLEVTHDLPLVEAGVSDVQRIAAARHAGTLAP
jgi:hypothetical protein